MQSYSMFIQKKGRPKTYKQDSCLINKQHKSIDTDALLSLFYLKKINQHHFDAAKMYEVLYEKYHSSIEAPKYARTSIEMVSTYSRKHASEDDQVLFKHWIQIRKLLANLHVDCESIIQKTIIDGSSHDTLLNPTNVTQNNMSIFRQGLEAIYQYSLSNSYLKDLIS